MDKKKIEPNHGYESFDKQYYRRFFDRYSKKEFEVYCRWAEGWIRFLDRYLPLKQGRGKKVLELGSSMGYFSKVFKDRGFKVVASDISSYIVNKAEKFQKGVGFEVIDVEKKIQVGGVFDYIVAFEVLEHLKNPGKALENIFEKLKKGGVLIFSTPFPTKRALTDPAHINVHEASWWLNLGIKSGFGRRRVVYATFIPFLYRINKRFSFGFPIKLNLPYVNSTCFMIFEK